MSEIDYLSENKKFFNDNFQKDSTEGILLFEAFYDSKQLIYGISKVALSFAKAQNLYPKILLPLSNTEGVRDFAESVCPNSINTKRQILLFAFTKVFFIIKSFLSINKKSDIVNLIIDDCEIGKHIYDSLLIRFKESTIDYLKFRHKKSVILEMLHFFLFKDILDNENVKCVVLGDNVYRYGLLFELCKKMGVRCIAPVNLNSFTFSKYFENDDFNRHSFAVESNLVSELKTNEDVIDEINTYFNNRYQGRIEQHDVLSAYKGKVAKDRNCFFNHYQLDPEKKLIVVMPHIFCDAPHAYPHTIYDDYYEWFVDTLEHLHKNKKVNFLVKEHPSAHLYNEHGIVKRILTEMGIQHLFVDTSESTVSILNNADAIITCGGTIGIEFACMGKPVVLAAHPPYSNLGFTIENNSIAKYHERLQNIHNIDELTDSQKRVALTTAYVMFYLSDNLTPDLEIGSERILL